MTRGTAYSAVVMLLAVSACGPAASTDRHTSPSPTPTSQVAVVPVLRNDWSLQRVSGRALGIKISGSNCAGPERVRAIESPERVELVVTAKNLTDPENGCLGTGRFTTKSVSLSRPLGKRELTGCRPVLEAAGEAVDCRRPQMDIF